MSLTIFDLDNTLLAGDSDYMWGEFLIAQGLVDADYYATENKRFYQEYQQGKLDIYAFLKFSLKHLTEHPIEKLQQLRNQFIHDIIQPILLKPAQQLIELHKKRGDTLLVITATNAFITEPIVKLYGIEHLLATTPQMMNNRYTGEVAGTPCFQEGKVIRLNQWLDDTKNTLTDSFFYSDSHNDLPLLKKVTHPIAVNPDNTLKDYAKSAQWPIISLRETYCPTEHLSL